MEGACLSRGEAGNIYFSYCLSNKAHILGLSSLNFGPPPVLLVVTVLRTVTFVGQGMDAHRSTFRPSLKSGMSNAILNKVERRLVLR
jgi:hypothetical protein